MKKITLLLSLIFCSFVVFSQSTSPRIGTGATQDVKGHFLTYKYVAIADTYTVAKDTIALNPNGYDNIYQFTLTGGDSSQTTLTAPINTRTYAGDKLEIMLNWVTLKSKKAATLGQDSTNRKVGLSFVMDSVKQVVHYTRKASAYLGQDSTHSAYVKTNWVLNPVANTKYLVTRWRNKAIIRFVFDGVKWIEVGRMEE